MQSDNLTHLAGNEYEVNSFKRILQSGTAILGDTTVKFKLILDARANTLTVTVGRDSAIKPGLIARTILFELKPIAGEKPILLPPRWDTQDEVVVCGVSDAMHVAGLLHTLRDNGPFSGEGRPARVHRPRMGTNE